MTEVHQADIAAGGQGCPGILSPLPESGLDLEAPSDHLRTRRFLRIQHTLTPSLKVPRYINSTRNLRPVAEMVHTVSCGECEGFTHALGPAYSVQIVARVRRLWQVWQSGTRLVGSRRLPGSVVIATKWCTSSAAVTRPTAMQSWQSGFPARTCKRSARQASS